MVTRLTHAAITGYEDDIRAFNDRKIAACAKHFIGDGGTDWETGSLQEGMHTYKIDRGNTSISEEELRRVHLPPYLEALNAGVKTIMISFNSWNGVKCHGSKYLINDLLKEELQSLVDRFDPNESISFTLEAEVTSSEEKADT